MGTGQVRGGGGQTLRKDLHTRNICRLLNSFGESRTLKLKSRKTLRELNVRNLKSNSQTKQHDQTKRL